MIRVRWGWSNENRRKHRDHLSSHGGMVIDASISFHTVLQKVSSHVHHPRQKDNESPMPRMWKRVLCCLGAKNSEKAKRKVMEIAASVLEVFALWKEVLDKKTSIRTHTADASIHTEEKARSENQEADARRTLHPN